MPSPKPWWRQPGPEASLSKLLSRSHWGVVGAEGSLLVPSADVPVPPPLFFQGSRAGLRRSRGSSKGGKGGSASFLLLLCTPGQLSLKGHDGKLLFVCVYPYASSSAAPKGGATTVSSL